MSNDNFGNTETLPVSLLPVTNKTFFLKYPFVLLLVAAVILASEIGFFQYSAPESLESIAGKAEKTLQQSEQKVLKKLNQLEALSSNDTLKEKIFNRHEDNLISYFAYLKDSLFAWSDNDMLISQEEADSLPSGSIVKLRNGWYEIFKATKGDQHFYSTLLIKSEFAYQNKFLINSFNQELKIPDSYSFFLFPFMGSVPVSNGLGKILFYLTAGETGNNVAPRMRDLSTWLYMLVVFLLLGAIYSFGKWILKKSFLLTVFFSLLIVGLRLLMIQLRIPDQLYVTELFSPGLYASSVYMNSLGDFLINVLLVLCLSLLFSNKGKQQLLTIGVKARIVVYSGLLIMGLLAAMLLNDLLEGIVFNSSINFNTANVFDLNGYSFIGLLIVAVLMLLFFMLIKVIVNFQRKCNWGNKTKVIGGGLLIVLFIFLTDPSVISGVVLFVSLYISIYWFSGRPGEKILRVQDSLSAIITFLFITSLYSSISIYTYSREKEKENRKLLAGKVETEQDRVAEHLFEDVQDKIAEDTTLQSYFKKPASASFLVSQRLHRRYFNGFWTKYEIDSYCFDTLNRPFNKTLDSTSYGQFQTIINSVGKPTYAENLFFLTKANGKSMYLARIPLMKNDSLTAATTVRPGGKKGTIFIEIEPKIIQATQGFPELFISDKVVFNKALADYSYARYKNDELVNQYGDFAYYFSSSVFGNQKGDYSFINRDGYNHLIYRESPSSVVVVSKKQDTVYELITSFSYFFAFFSILLLLFITIQNLLQGELTISLSLKNRIQVSVIAIVIFSVALIGVGTIYYIIKKYDLNQSVRISTQLKSLLVTIENDLDEQLKPDSALTEDILFKLSKLSGNASTDFNWYDVEGNLLFSSQPKIFDQGITSTLMNPIAFDELANKQQTQFVHPENIGKLNYIAAYQTLRNRQNELLGYISLPFFEKENELTRDISAFLSALINIYVLLLSLTVLVTFFIASRITKPLLLIQEKLANINLGKRNEFIQWNNKDEIGELVNEYNKKVEELALSADLLARSERESAWQEMAKQVAHEIKNPLTPMKLGVQHLLNAYNDNSPDKEELVKKISQTLIQQIDTLSNIANEFSNFAKMPQTRNEPVDLNLILSDAINLFKESPDTTITFNKDKMDVTHSFVFADKDQLIRLFSNLLKNAVQSIPPERKGRIDVFISLNQGFFTVAIKDNGVGIADNQAEKIFTPNFTTKSGGMGLGLAMVKNIVENSGGKVWFETKIGAGTSFFVTLPARRE